jgi:hypothetical protein
VRVIKALGWHRNGGRCRHWQGRRFRETDVARIAGVNIPTQKRVVIALQYIHGIGSKLAKEVCE